MADELSEPLRPLRRGSWWRTCVALGTVTVLITALDLWTYKDCLSCFFHFDDFWVLAASARIQTDSVGHLLRVFEPTHGFLLYRPLSTVLYFLGLRGAFGYDPVGYHATQIAFQILNAVLAYGVADSLLLSRTQAVAAALIYVTAPGHAIAACWMALFTMTGATFLYFIALLVWLRVQSRLRIPLTFLLFVTDLLASEHAITLPLALTAASFLVAPPIGWRRNARQLASFYVVGGVYAAAKLYYLRTGLATTFPNPAARAFVEAGYGISLNPVSILHHIGRYCTFTIDVLYGRLQSDTAVVVLGLSLLLAAAGATAVVVMGGRNARWLKVAAFGLDLFIIGLGPVLLLPGHVYSYYVGIAALGIALTVVSLVGAVPSLPRQGAVGLAALLVTVHLADTAATVRTSEEFRFFQSFSNAAAGWLYTLHRRADDSSVREVILPQTPVTDMVFTVGKSHQLFLCATYRVETMPSINTVEAKEGRLILSQPDPLPPGGALDRWAWLRPCGTQP